MQQFFYDAQIRRFLIQFTRIFSNFQVEYSRDEAGNPTYLRVPVKYGDSSRQAQTVLQNNSPNTMPSTPAMSFYVTSLDYDRIRVQEPYHVSSVNVRQRQWDEDSASYETTQGNAFTIERLMPVPYTLGINLDIWTSNTNQKFQLLEQILTLFNPALEIQSTDSYLDWTSLSVVELDTVTWSNRSIPTGTEDTIDIASIRFKLPIWISSPAKVKKLGVVEQIIASIFDENGSTNDAISQNDLLLGTRVKITPYSYKILLLGNQVQLIAPTGTADKSNGLAPSAADEGSNIFWAPLLNEYGSFRSGISQLRIHDSRLESEIVGTVAKHPTDDRFLLFSVDPATLPSNTLQPISAIIDPLRSGPGHGLDAPVTGLRYLLLHDIGADGNQAPAAAWGNIVARKNDIIEYNGNQWQVVFASSEVDSIEYVTNLVTSVQYTWMNGNWVKSYQGVYQSGDWSIVI